MKRFEKHKTVAVMTDTHSRLVKVKSHMMSIDRRVSNFDSVINELINVYEYNSTIKKDASEELEDESY